MHTFRFNVDLSAGPVTMSGEASVEGATMEQAEVALRNALVIHIQELRISPRDDAPATGAHHELTLEEKVGTEEK